MTIRRFTLLLCTLMLLSTQAVAKHKELVFTGPGTLVSYPLLKMIEDGALADYADKVTFKPWQTPDQMRAMIVSGQVHVSAIPTNVAAMFFNRGEPVRLLNVSVWGLLWLISADDNMTTLKGFQGKRIAIPFRNDMPDIIFRLLAKAHNLPLSTFSIQYVNNSMQATQLLLAGQIDNALLPEPGVSIALMRNQKKGRRPLYRAMRMSDLWAKAFPAAPRIPQAGIMSTRALAQEPALRQAIATAYDQASRWCQQHIQDCAELAHKYIPSIPVAGASAALRNVHLKSQPANAVKGDLEAFFQHIATMDKHKIGGKLPADVFYQP